MYNVYGVWAETYTEACLIAGVDTPAQIADEIAWRDELDFLESLSRPVSIWECPEHCPDEIPF